VTRIVFTLILSVVALFAAEKPKLPDGPGKATTVKLCGTCHAAEIVMSRRESVEGWSGVIEDMMMRGLKGSDDDFGEIVDYLVTHFPKGTPVPKVNVNRAERADIVAGLGIPDPIAASIVKYRTNNGPFKSADDLLKVPGLNAKTIEAKKNRIEF
jgi:competence protein ComEA